MPSTKRAAPRKIRASSSISGLEGFFERIKAGSPPAPNIDDFVTVVDATGKEIKTNDFPLLSLSLVYYGLTDEIKELESYLKRKIDASGHELSMIAAVSGYDLVMHKYIDRIGIAKIFQADGIISDFKLIESVTGHVPDERVHESVLAALGSLDSILSFMNGARKYLAYMHEQGALPSVQMMRFLYEKTLTPSYGTFLQRILTLYGIMGVMPEIDGKQVHPAEYAVRIADMHSIRPSSRSIVRVWPNDEAFLEEVISSTPFFFKQQAESYLEHEIKRIGKIPYGGKIGLLLKTAAQHKVSINKKLFENLPEIILSGLNNSFPDDAIKALAEIAESGAYQINLAEFKQSIRGGMQRIIYGREALKKRDVPPTGLERYIAKEMRGVHKLATCLEIDLENDRVTSPLYRQIQAYLAMENQKV